MTLILDSPERRLSGTPTFRRALVHDQNDGLTINFNGDYPGGVTLHSVTSITPHKTPDIIPALVVHGGISYEVGGLTLTGRTTRITVSLNEQISELQIQVSELASKVAALDNNPRQTARRFH